MENELIPFWVTWWIVFQTDPFIALISAAFGIFVTAWVIRTLCDLIR